MYYFRVTIAYKGSHYFGWQAQTLDTLHEERPTVEGTILNALRKIANYQPCSLSAASRTDSGVHAQAQMAKITLPIDISPAHLLMGLNSALPRDIRILECLPSAKSYQPNRGSTSKEYHYYFIAAPIDNAVTSDIAVHLPVQHLGAEELAQLWTACQLFTGRHDFYNFSSRDKSVKTSVREIFYCDIHRASFQPLVENLFYLKIIGDGFLRFMVRYLMGALFELARGNISIDDIQIYLQQRQDHKLCPKADARGLHLIKIEGSQN